MKEIKYKVYQVKEISKIDYWCMGYKWAVAHGFSLDNYQVVYEGVLQSYTEEEAKAKGKPYYKSTEEKLDALFALFNHNHPTTYTGRSMFTSDILEFEGVKYYKNPKEWIKL